MTTKELLTPKCSFSHYTAVVLSICEIIRTFFFSIIFFSIPDKKRSVKIFTVKITLYLTHKKEAEWLKKHKWSDDRVIKEF